MWQKGNELIKIRNYYKGKRGKDPVRVFSILYSTTRTKEEEKGNN